MKERIQKALATLGIDSRRHIEEMVQAGRVAVNGKVVRKMPVMVDLDEDTIEIDDVEISSPSKAQRRRNRDRGPVYVIMYKPKGVYSTNVAQGEQQRAIDLLPPGFDHRVYPVGRLDAESEGLLLLCNDGELTNQLTHPRYGISKTYRCYCDGSIPQDTVNKLIHGVWLADPEKGGFRAKAAKVEVVKRLREKTVLDITLTEGRNRQVRRMLAAMGHKVRGLTRVKFGPLTLKGLKPGDSRLLTAGELRALQAAVAKASEQAERGAKPGARGKKPRFDSASPKPHRDDRPRLSREDRPLKPKPAPKQYDEFDDEPSAPRNAPSHPLGITRDVDDEFGPPSV
ncbi:MAG: pseudouridine synthase [Tepidisphaeraceae bacterium]